VRHIVVALLVVLDGLVPGSSLNRALAQQSGVPRDGQFYVEARPAFVFKATLAEDWVCPQAGDGTLHVYAPILPELPGQGKVSSRLYVARNNKLKAERITEASSHKPRMLALAINSDELSPKAGIPLRLTYEGILFARSLTPGRPHNKVPELTKEERQLYLKRASRDGEFFVEKCGWVPVDLSGTIMHKPKNPYAFFGNHDGGFLVVIG
jgi:hypothetical protein